MSADAVSFYLDNAARYPLLTATEEIHLARKVQAMIALQEANPAGPYTRDERRILHQGRKAKDRMILANMRLVMTVAKKFHRGCRHLALEDLLQEGVLGLIRGVERFDPERGYKFSTLGFWWIRQGVVRAASQLDRAIRLPCGGMEALLKARKFVETFRAQHGHPPSIEQIAEHCKISANTMKGYLAFTSDAGSLDAQVKGGEGSSIGELVTSEDMTPWEHAELVAEQEEIEQLVTEINAAIDRLTPAQSQAIKLMYQQNITGPKAAKMLGISRQAVSDQALSGISKLRKEFAAA